MNLHKKQLILHSTKKSLTFRLLLHVSRMFSILLMFSSEINISVTADPGGSGLSGPDVSGTVSNLSGKALERTDALLEGRSDTSSAGGKDKETQSKLGKEKMALKGFKEASCID